MLEKRQITHRMWSTFLELLLSHLAISQSDLIIHLFKTLVSLDFHWYFAEGLHWDAAADGGGETHFAGRRLSDTAEASPNQSRGEIAQEDSTQDQE